MRVKVSVGWPGNTVTNSSSCRCAATLVRSTRRSLARWRSMRYSASAAGISSGSRREACQQLRMWSPSDAMMHQLTILIDGYNVSRNMRGSRLEDGVALGTARENLLAMVRQRFRGTPYHVAVIFDGNGEREVCAPIKGLHGGKCIFTQRDTSADAVIVRLAAEASGEGREVVVCTNDLE